MLVLKNLEGEVYNLFTKSEHIIGRFGDLELLKDTSVSRQHACIRITFQNGRPKIMLQDLGSKYGTYVNNNIASSKPISKSVPITLKIADKVRFGQQWNTWTVEENTFIISTSKLSVQEQNYLKGIVGKLNGIIVSDWMKDCTHLTVNKIRTSVKVLCALAHVKPIVSIDYWKRLISVISSNLEQPIPNCDDFIPPLAEQQTNLSSTYFKMNKVRKTLFQNMKFIAFGSEQYNDILPMVEAAGGTAFDGNIFKISDKQLEKERIVILQKNKNDAASSNFRHISAFLDAHNQRFVQEAEICLSLAHCSTEKYCNPSYDISILLQQSESQITIKDEATILANETQDTDMVENTQFRETESGNFSLTVNENRVFSESEDEDIYDSGPSVIEDSQDRNSTSRKKENNIFGSWKRKLELSNETSSKAKHSRLDNWLINKKPNNSNESENSISDSTHSITTTKKNFKNIFNFRTERKTTEKSSSSLFSGMNQAIPINSSLVTEKKSDRATSSLFAGMNGKVGENTNVKKKDGTTGFFVSMNRKTNGSTSSLFASPENFSRNSSLESGKRKRSDDFDEIPEASKSKNTISKTKSLFECSSISKISRCVNSVVIDSGDECSDSFTKNTSKLSISNCIPKNQERHVIATTVSLSQFIDIVGEKNSSKIKSEPLDESMEVRNKIIIHTVPLIKCTQSEAHSERLGDRSKINFKKFHKSNICYLPPPRTITTTGPILNN